MWKVKDGLGAEQDLVGMIDDWYELVLDLGEIGVYVECYRFHLVEKQTRFRSVHLQQVIFFFSFVAAMSQLIATVCLPFGITMLSG